jgi:hypothetical protein
MPMVISHAGHFRIPGSATYNVVLLKEQIAETGRLVLQRLRQDNRMAFSNQGHAHHGGNRWRQLRPSTIAVKRGDSRILIRTGAMRRRQSTLGKFRLSGKTVTWVFNSVNNSPYSHFHQAGFVHAKAGLVRPRPPVMITKQDKRNIDAAFMALRPPAGPKKPKGRVR